MPVTCRDRATGPCWEGEKPGPGRAAGCQERLLSAHLEEEPVGRVDTPCVVLSGRAALPRPHARILFGVPIEARGFLPVSLPRLTRLAFLPGCCVIFPECYFLVGYGRSYLVSRRVSWFPGDKAKLKESV